MWTLIKTFYSNHKFPIIVGALALVFAVVNLIQFNENGKLKKQLVVAEQNYNAAQDSIRITRDNSGKIEYDKLSFLTSRLDDLEKLNTDLYNEVKNTKGDVHSIIQMGAEIKHDTIPLLVQSNVKDGIVVSNFGFDTTYSPGNYRKIAGFTKYDLKSDQSTGTLTTDQIAFSATTGIRELNGKREIFFKPDYPGMVVTKLNGAEIDKDLYGPTQGPLFNFTISAGYLPFIYNWKTKKSEFLGSNIGVNAGVSVNVNRLFKK